MSVRILAINHSDQFVVVLHLLSEISSQESSRQARALQVPPNVVPEVREDVAGLALAAATSEVEGLEWGTRRFTCRSKFGWLPLGVCFEEGYCRSYHALQDALVAQCFSQTPGIDYFDTYASVAKMASIRTYLALSAELDNEIHQVDSQKRLPKW